MFKKIGLGIGSVGVYFMATKKVNVSFENTLLKIDKIVFNRHNINNKKELELKNLNPWNLPNIVDSFTGREEELELLEKLLTTKSIACITGLSGVGKTALAVKYAKKHKEKYDFTAFFNSNNKESFNSELRELAKYLDFSKEPDEQHLVHMVYKKLCEKSTKKVLLIFDNNTVRDNLDLLEDLNKIDKIITTIDQTLVKKDSLINLKSFSINDAMDYIKQRLPSEYAKDVISSEKLAKALGCFPLALSYATAYINQNINIDFSISKYVELYEKQKKDRLDLLSQKIGTEIYSSPVYNTLQLSIKAVKEKDKRIFELLNHCSFLASAFIPLPLIEAIIDEKINTAGFLDIIATLRQYSLVDVDNDLAEHQPKGIILHSILQEVIKLDIKEPNEEKYRKRLIDIVHKESQSQTNSYSQDEDRKRTLFPHVICLSNYYQGLLERNNSWQWCIKKQLNKIVYNSFVKEADHLADIWIYISECRELLLRGDEVVIEDYYKKALKIKEEIYGQGSLQTVPALKRLAICDKDKAEEYFRRAIQIMEITAPQNIELFRIKSCLANVLTEKGGLIRLQEAEQLYEESIKMQKIENCKNDQKDSVVLSSSILNFGILKDKLGNLDKAIELTEEAYDIRKKACPGHSRIIPVLESLANFYSKRDEYDKTVKVLEEALNISKSYYGDNHKKTIELVKILSERKEKQQLKYHLRNWRNHSAP